MPFEPLAFPFERDGFRHEFVEREGGVCLVRRLNLRITPTPSVHWEVVILQRRRAEVVPRGVAYPAREVYPGTEEWGEHGWTFLDVAAARAKMAELCARLRHTRARGTG